jgi:polyhydroxyalkanoate synthase subunit PhaC
MVYAKKTTAQAEGHAHRSAVEVPAGSDPIVHPVGWAFYEQLDVVRRGQGRLLDALGCAPRRTPARPVLRQAGVNLWCHGANGDGAARPVLFIPAPIKRAYLWDLDPAISVVGAALTSHLRPYLLEWAWPAADAATQGLDDCAARMLLACLAAIERETEQRRVTLVGHSLGGTLAAIFAALHPERIRGLVLLGAPLRFDPRGGGLGLFAGTPVPMTPPPFVPGSFLSSSSSAAFPQTFVAERGFDLFASLGHPGRMRTHGQVVRWTLDELPMPRALFQDVLEHLIRRDLFMRGALPVGGRTAAPANVTAPLLCVADAHCAVVPPAAVLPFLEAVGSRTTRMLWYQRENGVGLQHVGMLVGRNAHQRLWPDVLAWIRDLPV